MANAKLKSLRLKLTFNGSRVLECNVDVSRKDGDCGARTSDDPASGPPATKSHTVVPQPEGVTLPAELERYMASGSSECISPLGRWANDMFSMRLRSPEPEDAAQRPVEIDAAVPSLQQLTLKQKEGGAADWEEQATPGGHSSEGCSTREDALEVPSPESINTDSEHGRSADSLRHAELSQPARQSQTTDSQTSEHMQLQHAEAPAKAAAVQKPRPASQFDRRRQQPSADSLAAQATAVPASASRGSSTVKDGALPAQPQPQQQRQPTQSGGRHGDGASPAQQPPLGAGKGKDGASSAQQPPQGAGKGKDGASSAQQLLQNGGRDGTSPARRLVKASAMQRSSSPPPATFVPTVSIAPERAATATAAKPAAEHQTAAVSAKLDAAQLPAASQQSAQPRQDDHPAKPQQRDGRSGAASAAAAAAAAGTLKRPGSMLNLQKYGAYPRERSGHSEHSGGIGSGTAAGLKRKSADDLDNPAKRRSPPSQPSTPGAGSSSGSPAVSPSAHRDGPQLSAHQRQLAQQRALEWVRSGSASRQQPQPQQQPPPQPKADKPEAPRSSTLLPMSAYLGTASVKPKSLPQPEQRRNPAGRSSAGGAGSGHRSVTGSPAQRTSSGAVTAAHQQRRAASASPGQNHHRSPAGISPQRRSPLGKPPSASRGTSAPAAALRGQPASAPRSQPAARPQSGNGVHKTSAPARKPAAAFASGSQRPPVKSAAGASAAGRLPPKGGAAQGAQQKPSQDPFLAGRPVGGFGGGSWHGFREGQVVWAKMQGFPHWPAQVQGPTAEAEGSRPGGMAKPVFVVFFGTGEYQWLPAGRISPFHESYKIRARAKDVQQAVDAAWYTLGKERPSM